MLTFITSNQNKIDVATKFLNNHLIQFQSKGLELEEIQSNEFEQIAIKKAQAAFQHLKSPLFISDHCWSITALNGFPGAFMKYMNDWLTADDFLRLMHGKENRDIILTDLLCYIDEREHKVFTKKHMGKILYKAHGEGLPAMQVTSITYDGISIAKKLESEPSVFDNGEEVVYDLFGKWITDNRPEFLTSNA